MADKPARRGRPPKISSNDIADAAIRLGIENATIRNVASELGVSVMGVYHHVRNADDLMDLALSRKVGALLGPIDRKDTFEDTLRDAAVRYHALLTGQPEAQMRLVRGQIDALETARYYELLVGAGLAHGFSAAESFEAVRLVMTAAVGAAMMRPVGFAGPDAQMFSVLRRGMEEAEAAGDRGPGDGGFANVLALLAERGDVSANPLEAVDAVLETLRRKFGARMTQSNAEAMASGTL